VTPHPDLHAERLHANSAQTALTAADPPFAVSACPGAGKTRIIVDRHINRHVPARKGRAITSFTRVAAATINRRCHAENRLDLTDHPHFIGTFDTFLWLHLVRPYLPVGRDWQRLDSWRDAPAKLRAVTIGQTSIQLADVHFEPDIHGVYTAKLTGPAAYTEPPPGWEAAVQERRKELSGKGYLTGAELRSAACRHLRQYSDHIATILAAKYDELIVDEAQDCSATDLHILTELHEHGLPLILIADPDQAIYDFRGAASADLHALNDRLGAREITRNWRSSTTICRLAATLRISGRAADIAVADHHDDDAPILLYDAAAQDAAVHDFLTYAHTRDITADQCMILAHSASTLPRKYAGPQQPPSSNNIALIWSVGILNDFPAAPAKTRLIAHDILARTILRWWYGEADMRTRTAALNENALDPTAFERLIHRVRAALPSLDEPTKDWLAAATKVLNENPPAPGLERTTTKLITPPGKSATPARKLASLPDSYPVTTGLPRISTVHQVKGDEAEAVLVLLPKGKKGKGAEGNSKASAAMEEWLGAENLSSEAIRVLYVAATRARRLLAIAVPAEFKPRTAEFLKGLGVPVQER
jgi:DNA helicase-2/ATP-dependent DNA helicase PcrA